MIISSSGDNEFSSFSNIVCATKWSEFYFVGWFWFIYEDNSCKLTSTNEMSLNLDNSSIRIILQIAPDERSNAVKCQQ